MHVHSKDWTPRFLLERRRLSVLEWVGGFASVGLAVVLPATILVVTGAVSAALGDGFEDTAPVVEEEVIAARFVQLGRDFQDELPNRIVPQAATAPPDSVALSENPDEPPPEREERERPEEALERSLDNLLDRTEAFAEEVEAREREGRADGIEDGTETTATEGDIYAGQLRNFFWRGWTVPTTISDEERNGLQVDVTITVTESLQVVSSRLRGTSGNPDFDQSVIARIESVKASNDPIPEPPLAVRPRYVGAPFTLRFSGRGANR